MQVVASNQDILTAKAMKPNFPDLLETRNLSPVPDSNTLGSSNVLISLKSSCRQSATLLIVARFESRSIGFSHGFADIQQVAGSAYQVIKRAVMGVVKTKPYENHYVAVMCADDYAAAASRERVALKSASRWLGAAYWQLSAVARAVIRALTPANRT